MKTRFPFYASILALVLVSCKTVTIPSNAIVDDGKITITFVQINDVYEIAPMQGGKVGGVARVSTLKKEELAKNPNTFMVMAGDFLSPSVYNSLKYEGKSIRGKQMVESLNSAGLDLAVFGNHEFDIKEAELQDRINESTFNWVASNTFHKTKSGIAPFVKTTSSGKEPFPETYIMEVQDQDGTKAKIGFIGLTLPFNKADYVSYTDEFEAAEKWYNQLKESCDAVVALTHLAVEEDSVLARRLPGLALIMGGHEHDMQFKKIGDIYITKAHANAKSAYVNYLTIDVKNKTTSVVPELRMIDTTVVEDPETALVVKKWMDIGEKNYEALGFNAKRVIREEGEPLDGREEMIRSGKTNLTRIAVSAMEKAVPTADVVLLNSGSIRVDDVLQMPVTEYDIIRTLPYGGAIMEVDMRGNLLTKVLEAGRNNVGSGGFLQYSSSVNYNPATRTWTLKDAPINPKKSYHVALADFLMTGGEANMGFLNKDNPDIIKIYPTPTSSTDLRSDSRLAIIKYMAELGK
ncbi:MULTISPECIES: bifunctional UDP-sugar hydrolase/5'-nucleotidase [unclassified Kaistella]|uniref:bifunctional metallophosphatase/5'-nucleotidase n=1 Tax=unclassified Kaistella TaxID=2762626 RepID=UPI0027322C1D|nr:MULTISPECIES: bifunctional metallophosphatase/5'-nucleotidase [unclassified Kaistella]MDP2453171.1 bifunctional metallophosphatase/5'-nucleotidase [Kaistella sp. SH11-4b]MDP2456228.1 bifunctional metallophosphatase/5'-nucleotidase [Kaistella sp. SH40-3]MDP2458984.1 bifunctional metallophosphatase/5'-nucleotidase [Kaistella sp. SH19-2b]